MRKGSTKKRYSEVSKRQAVRDIEKGKVTEAELRRRYGITGTMTVRGWLKRYGTGRVTKNVKVRHDVVESRRVLVWDRQKRELEQALARLTVEKVALESLIDEAQSGLGLDLKKLSVWGDSACHGGTCAAGFDSDNCRTVPLFRAEPASVLSTRGKSASGSAFR